MCSHLHVSHRCRTASVHQRQTQPEHIVRTSRPHPQSRHTISRRHLSCSSHIGIHPFPPAWMQPNPYHILGTGMVQYAERKRIAHSPQYIQHTSIVHTWRRHSTRNPHIMHTTHPWYTHTCNPYVVKHGVRRAYITHTQYIHDTFIMQTQYTWCIHIHPTHALPPLHAQSGSNPCILHAYYMGHTCVVLMYTQHKTCTIHPT